MAAYLGNKRCRNIVAWLALDLFSLFWTVGPEVTGAQGGRGGRHRYLRFIIICISLTNLKLDSDWAIVLRRFSATVGTF